MVRRHLIAGVALVLAVWWSASVLACASARSYLPATIEQVVIKENGAVDHNSSGAGAEDCASFRITDSVVKNYFQNAYPIASTHGYQWSGCKATGTIKFASGDKGTWQINSSRLGFLSFGDGRSFTLFCKDSKCGEEPFAKWRGINADSDPTY